MTRALTNDGNDGSWWRVLGWGRVSGVRCWAPQVLEEGFFTMKTKATQNKPRGQQILSLGPFLNSGHTVLC